MKIISANNAADAVERAIDKSFKFCENQSLLFAEWIDLNGIRQDKHEWRCKVDNYSQKYSTEEMFILFKKQIKL